MEKIYNVYSIKVDNLRGVELLSRNCNMTEVEAWENSQHVDRLENFIAGYEVGSPRDLELAKDIK